MFKFLKKGSGLEVANNTQATNNTRDTATNENDTAETETGPLIGSRNQIDRIVAIISGKGGVGKSTTTSLLASGLIMRGYRVGILDADITGPSIPRAFGIKGGHMAKNDFGIIPNRTRMNIKIMSLNLFLQDEDDPVIWRGPRISGAVNEFYTQVDWGHLDFLLLDMPPGTGDIAITVLQNIHLDGAVVVTTPQDIAFKIVRKAYHMLNKHNVPVIGMVENFKMGMCPNCGQGFDIFTGTGIKRWCEENQVNYLGSIPWDVELGSMTDKGKIEDYYNKEVDYIVDNVLHHFFT